MVVGKPRDKLSAAKIIRSVLYLVYHSVIQEAYIHTFIQQILKCLVRSRFHAYILECSSDGTQTPTRCDKYYDLEEVYENMWGEHLHGVWGEKGKISPTGREGWAEAQGRGGVEWRVLAHLGQRERRMQRLGSKRESTVPWGSHIIFGLFRAERGRGRAGAGKGSGKGKEKNSEGTPKPW